MKKAILAVATIVFLGNLSATAQEKAKKAASKAKMEVAKKVEETKFEITKVSGPGMYVEKETIDYGTIEQGAEGKREFVIVNNGNEPLVISNAQGSCGCTVPSFPKEPIAPGAKAVIGVKYDTNRVGAINKSVTVTTNMKDNPTKVLHITGNVVAKPTPTSPLDAKPTGPTAQ
ncbi:MULTISPECIES: DUF1573 domain-containing protein [Flavobacterium]|uniref:DUF1573 domain-containing protein n=2 Tax=Flavobacterium TaxID=237 RepID=A0AA94F149_9FLAO|nr:MULTISPECIES: DUF1573 domain-containing protein [Flavobacterium]OXA83059.1 hypothetical protein B0A56_02900 [Flavobacterium columnare NBRC 100251 = ATCC 23463]AMA50158.1 hypothetical protein AWN65_12160 [Flavobacterium covae]AND64322.1 hypothetical protein AX766_07800 [Flavobacterium covae]MCH4829373.1 DUF1573 domain-containing protein [Flavobacterium columnare]MCH4834149.1 DUF1573 domain-containing protein [Flavobacterium columnare]